MPIRADFLSQLVDVLVELYPDQLSARHIAMIAGLTLGQISFDARASNTWASILDEAEKQDRMQALLDQARLQYPVYDGLNSAYLAYTEWVQFQPPAPDDKSPFMGLQFFDVADAANFFGREALTAHLVTYLKTNSLLAVVGASGSGKSSLVRAGLVPALQQSQPLTDGTQPPKGCERWPVHVITPTARPLESVASSLTRDSEGTRATRLLLDELAEDARSLHLHVSKLLRQPGNGERLLLVVDQFEELFTLCKDRTQRKAFVDALLAATCPEEDTPCTPANSIVTVVLTLRADFYAHCAEFENLRIALQNYQCFIGAMSKDELRRAIEGPAQCGGWELEAGLVNALLKDVGNEPGALPLLSHALLETWKRRRGRTLTLAGYVASGQVQGAIAKTADDVYGQDLTPEQQAIARNIFLRLTELGEGAQDTRRRVRLSELIPQNESAEGMQAVLQKLTDRRLVTTFEGEVEVAHEALIREWPALREWLAEDREALRVQHRLGEVAHEWETHNEDDSYLYTGVQLVQAEEMSKAHGGQLSQSEARFLGASLALRARKVAEKEKEEQEKLAAALALADKQEQLAENERLRAEEQTAAASGMRRRALAAGLIGILAVLAAAAAGIGWIRAQEQTRLADDRTEIARTILGVQRDFLAQAETGRLTREMLSLRREQLAQSESVIASGIAPEVILPDLRGQDYEIAQQILDEACEPRPCLRSQIRWAPDNDMASRLVLETDPRAGQELLWGSAVTMTVSQGKPLSIVSPIKIELMPVPAGSFLRGGDPNLDVWSESDEQPQRPITLPEFYVGKHEITNDQYAAFVRATGHSVPSHWENGRIPGGKENHPVVKVAWADAVAFTQWLAEATGITFRLCTEAEWEKACRSTDGWIFPWGNSAPGHDKLNYDRKQSITTTPAGFHSKQGDSPYGAADMAGNVWEWVADWYDSGYYTHAPTASPTGPESGSARVLRGGAVDVGIDSVRCGDRFSYKPSDKHDVIGFRVCTFKPEE